VGTATVTLSQSSVRNNTASTGAGLFNDSLLTLNASPISAVAILICAVSCAGSVARGQDSSPDSGLPKVSVSPKKIKFGRVPSGTTKTSTVVIFTNAAAFVHFVQESDGTRVQNSPLRQSVASPTVAAAGVVVPRSRSGLVRFVTLDELQRRGIHAVAEREALRGLNFGEN
jgi:hypothetical protein